MCGGGNLATDVPITQMITNNERDLPECGAKAPNCSIVFVEVCLMLGVLGEIAFNWQPFQPLSPLENNVD
jgi:hypothetical protein